MLEQQNQYGNSNKVITKYWGINEIPGLERKYADKRNSKI